MSLPVLKLHDLYDYNLLEFIRFTMKIFMNHIYLFLNYHTRNSQFNLTSQLDWKLKGTRIECFNVAPAQLCVTMSDYSFKINYKIVVLESYGRYFFI